MQINPGRSNKARVNRSPLPRARELLGLVRTVLFSPEDLALVKGDPSERRRFLDDLLVQRAPRYAGVRSDYDRVLKQRNSLLKTAGSRPPPGPQRGESALSTLGVWDSHLARTGAGCWPPGWSWSTSCGRYVAARPTRRSPRARAAPTRRWTTSRPSSSAGDDGARDRDVADRGAARRGRAPPRRRDRPRHLPGRSAPRRPGADARAAAGQGLRLPRRVLVVRAGAAAGVLRPAPRRRRRPVLILDDVFAELDTERRERLAELVAGAEQVLVTAAVPDDVPGRAGRRADRRRRREGAPRCRLTTPPRRSRVSRPAARRSPGPATTTPASTWPAASLGRWPGPAPPGKPYVGGAASKFRPPRAGSTRRRPGHIPHSYQSRPPPTIHAVADIFIWLCA